MDEAAPGEAAAATEKKRRLLRRVPTPLVVTLLGIALTAWLLPAFTRQWSDRQKAHEIQAELVLILTTNAPFWLVNVIAGVVYAVTMPFVALTTAYVYIDARTRSTLEAESELMVLPAEIKLSGQSS